MEADEVKKIASCLINGYERVVSEGKPIGDSG